MRLANFHLFIINFDIVLLLDTQYIHFSVLVVWPAHSSLIELSTQFIFLSLDHSVYKLI